MGENRLSILSKRYPFISLCVYGGIEYVGIIQNRDDHLTTIYDFGSIISPDLKHRYLELANIWWWESNHSVPINIFLKQDWEPFRVCLKNFVNRDLEIVHGPVCSLANIAKRKSKRRSITLVKRVG
jgi:hypothetical protein